jgi:hypothetical protein
VGALVRFEASGGNRIGKSYSLPERQTETFASDCVN